MAAYVDPELAVHLDVLKADDSAPHEPPSATGIRVVFDAVCTTPFKAYMEPLLPQESAYVLQDRKVAVEGGEIIVRCVVPVVEDDVERFPVLVNIHGGGWTAGSIELDDYFLRKLSVDLRIVTVNIEYRLAPEHPFPTAVNDCLAALKWIVLNTAFLKADLSKGFLVGGHSAGGNLAAVLAHEARDDPFFSAEPGRQITGQVLREPVGASPDAYPEWLKPEMLAMEENRHAPLLPRAIIEHLADFYNPPRTDPRFAPLLYPSHVGVPRAFVQAMGLDALRDDGRAYAKAMRVAGGEGASCDRYPGAAHGFHYTFPDIALAVRVREDLVQGINWLLGREAVSEPAQK
ncbi:Alpha/Beta hydrolase protein [Lenzites betulinus]|nr:Alpha/Beta hydrolase protein [Lenzites betulinus]